MELVDEEGISLGENDRVVVEMDRVKPFATSIGYDVLRPIGNGSFGATFLVVPSFGDGDGKAIPRVIKVSPKRKPFDDNTKQTNEFRSTWESEGRIMLMLDHKNIIKTHYALLAGNFSWIVTDYASCSMFDLVHDKKANHLLNDKTGPCIIRQMLEGVAYLHDNNIMHRDLSILNFMITIRGVVKIIDFGAAVIAPAPIKKISGITRCATVYNAPEHLYHATTYHFPVDIWVLGIVFIEMFVDKFLPDCDSNHDQRCLVSQIIGPHPQDTGACPVPQDLAFTHGKEGRVAYTTPFRFFLLDILKYNPDERPTAKKLLDHDYLTIWHPRREDVHIIFSGGDGTLKKAGCWHDSLYDLLP